MITSPSKAIKATHVRQIKQANVTIHVVYNEIWLKLFWYHTLQGEIAEIPPSVGLKVGVCEKTVWFLCCVQTKTSLPLHKIDTRKIMQ